MRVGAYEIEREIGRGGMGTVYLAFRADAAFEKKVAIKVTTGALASADAVERFKRERQILARLEHPNIARLIDGGATREGMPYLVMELIDGQPLHVYCDQKRLPTVKRLELFLAVCSAVAYAHHELVIHRDLKPANILVTPEGVPRLLDFGIAKLVDPEAGAEAAGVTALAFTPWYASPEQVRGEPLATATDIYSLGVVLYELLTGHGPYRLQTWNPLEVLRAVVEQEPEVPSSAVDRTVSLPASAGQRRAVLTPRSVSSIREGTPARLRSRLRGDLDAILLTALRKEPERRYPSVAALAADIQAHLEGRPVSARRDSALYRAGKFVRRHRWGTVAALAILTLVAGGAANVVVQSQRVARERDRAARIQRFLVELFNVSDPGEARGSTVTAREVLDKGAAKVRQDLEAQPEAKADIMETMADVYNRLGLNARAADLAREALAFRRQSRDREPKALANTLNLLGSILMDQGRNAEAETAYREALELRRRSHGEKSLEVAQTLNNLGGVLDTLGRYDESDRLQQESLEIKRQLLGPEHPSIATGLYNLGIGLYRRGDLKGAEARLSESLAIMRKAYGEDHPEVAFTMQSLGVLYDDTGRYEEAEQIYREALALQRKVLGQEHPDIVTTLTNLANTLNHTGRLAEAEAVLREALPMSRKLYGEEAIDTAHVLAALAEAELRLGHLEAAERDAASALAVREKAFGLEHPDTAEARVLHGRVLVAQRRYAEAETALRLGFEVLEKQPGPEARRIAARQALAELYEKWRKPAEAARYR
jgi:serine/threonine-protein kinase